MALELNDGNFNSEIITGSKIALVDFWAAWCGPCQMMAPIIDELSKEMGDKVKIAKMDVDSNPGKASELGIMSLPTMKIFKDGKVVKEFIGVQKKSTLKEELEKLLEKNKTKKTENW